MNMCFVPPSKVGEGIACLHLCLQLFYISIWLLFIYLFFFFFRSLIVTEKPDFDKVNRVVSMISIITISVKLMHMI